MLKKTKKPKTKTKTKNQKQTNKQVMDLITDVL